MRMLAILLALLIATPARAAPDAAEGNWAVRSDGRILMIVGVRRVSGAWRGHWLRPLHFSTDDGWRSVSRVEGPMVDRVLVSADRQSDGLHLTFAGASAKDRDTMILITRPDGTARIAWPGGPGSLLVMDRAKPGEMPIRADPGATYPVDQHWKTNAEMTAIFDADQGDRTASRIDWKMVRPRDEARRARTKALLDSGKLESGADFYHAAFVFQHGDAPDDYLLAHSLATIAVARGRPDATWIAAATLDRYLQRIGQKQIFGTQYGWSDGKPVSQDPYDKALLSDAMREAMGVPPIAAQEERRARLEVDRAAKK